MNADQISLSDTFTKDLKFLTVSVLIVLLAVAGHNYVTPDEPLRVGMVELETRCVGVDAGICIGIERRTHTTFNYDNYTEIEPGTSNFYRKVESELMAQAYRICGKNTSDMKWTSEASYRNRTADEWLETDEVELLPCEKTTYRKLTDN